MIDNTATVTRWIALRCALVLIAVALVATPVQAASLGDIEVKSRLYEPFHAQIALRGVSETELEGLKVTLADQAVFDQAGLSRPGVLSRLKFEVIASGTRRGYVRITSHDRIREPSLSFIIDAQFAAGTLQRRFDVLLDLK